MTASEQEIADLERMSGNYEPVVTGPLVGELQSTDAIIAEYAQADPIYVHKTRALPAQFSHYRTLRGDGNCGWRALAFGFFEALLRIGDASKVLEELDKLKKYNKRLDAIGFTPDQYEDFTDATFELLQQTAANLPNHDNGEFILAAFNDPEISPQITYHFRLITTAWMRSHPDYYADFLPDSDVETYCRTTIEPSAKEIDNVGLQVLATALINEAGIAIEVVYLDRSPGAEVNRLEWNVLDADGNKVESASTIRLLYRPGHYDLLYKSEDIFRMSIAPLANPQVHLVTAVPSFSASDTAAYSYGMDTINILAECLPGYTMGIAPSYTNLPYHQPQPVPSPPKTRLSPTTTTGSMSPASQKAPATSPSPSALRIEKFRTTMEQLELNYDLSRDKKSSEEQDQTSFAREEDPCHFLNSAFQPHIWRPERDFDKPSDSGPSRKGSS